jgi:hypothetical protein
MLRHFWRMLGNRLQYCGITCCAIYCNT